MSDNQRKLFIIFATSIFILLVSFSIIAYISTSSSINYQLQLKSANILKTEQQEHFIKRQDGLHLSLNNIQKEASNQLYFIVQDNKIIKQPAFQQNLIHELYKELAHNKEYYHRYINLRNAHYYVSSNAVKLYDGKNAYIYTVFDTTESYHGLSQLKNVLIGLTLIYIFIILLITYMFSRKAMAPLKVAAERQKQFVQDASHELKTPLAVMKAGTEVLEAYEKQKLSALGQEMVQDMKHEIEEMDQLITDLLSLARLEQYIQLDTINLSEILIKQIAYYKDKQVNIDDNIIPNIYIQGNTQSLEQGLKILFENALKYAGEHTAITIELLDLNQITLIFKDNGNGVAEKDLPHLFERFYRGSNQMNHPGSGIGLALFKEIMDKNEAQVKVENNNGLMFKILFKKV